MNELARAGLGTLVVVGSVTGLGELFAFFTWTARKRTLYLAAANAARQKGKPLLVIGRSLSMYGASAHG